MPGYLHLPPRFPQPWAPSWGEDEFGLWMGLEVESVRQVFRWIEPGSFQMGSPIEESKRDDDETQHQVSLTRGFWLADSCVTQALWLAVMEGENPASFSENSENPVESVSWEQAKEFIQRLNEKNYGLEATLPTEAQWEYACRAGTTTAFSLGGNITSEQVNYDGNYPYAGKEKGEFREKTVPVKSLPANLWGLYEMHGNVWEWCHDWYAEYSGDAIDPTGPEAGDGRVLRGGSWIYDGRHCRSAARNMITPDYRYDFIGFRLALGQ